MNTYKIYKLNPNVVGLLEQYPEVKNQIINIEPKNVFFTKQMECLFGNNEGVSDFIEYKLKDRYDYHRDKNKHVIDNQLTKEENEVIERLAESFEHSASLNKHLKYLYAKGEIYTIFNNNLLFHGCVPVNEKGNLKEIKFLGKKLKGKKYFDEINETVNKVFLTKKPELVDLMWFLWISPDSPFFGKGKMATFESYFVKDKSISKEPKSPYYEYSENEDFCVKILKEFGIEGEDSHILNGHMPVKVKDGESPIKANGKLLVIDGGLAKSFREKTGNAGYILTYNSHGLLLSQNKPFESVEKAILEEKDIISEIIVKETNGERKRVSDTDIGTKLKGEIADLQELIQAYKNGEIKENKGK